VGEKGVLYYGGGAPGEKVEKGHLIGGLAVREEENEHWGGIARY